MKRPAFCPKEDHNKEELKYFCKDCETPVCQICVTVEHGGHNIKLIKEGAERQKTEIKSFIEKQRHNLQAKMNAVSRLDEDCARITQQGEDVKREIQTFVDKLIAVIEANKKNIFTEVDKETSKSIESITRRKTEIERQMTAIKLSLEKAEKLFTRSTNAEIVQLKKSSDTIFEGVHQIEPTDCDPELVAQFVFVENYKLFNTVKTEQIGTLKKPTKASHCDIEGKGLEEGIALREAHFTLTTKDTEGRQCYNERDHVTVEIRDEQGRECTSEIQINDCKDGLYQVRYCPRHPVKCQVTVKVNGEHVRDSPFAVQVTPFQFKPVLSFGKVGSSKGILRLPWGVAVNAKDEIAVTDLGNQRVQIFNSEGNYLRSLGRSATKEGEFNFPTGITYHNNGNIFVADNDNGRIQIFSGKGKYVGTFGKGGSLDSRLSNSLRGLSVDSDGNIIVADSGNRLIKIFSPDGNFLTKIGKQGSLTNPVHCIQYERYLIVSDRRKHCIKVFDRKGNFQYKFGKKGGGNGELSSPCDLLVNKSGHLMVCDQGNHRIQVFELNGKFLGKFGKKGANLGEFNNPTSLAVLSNGQIVVCEAFNHLFIFLGVREPKKSLKKAQNGICSTELPASVLSLTSKQTGQYHSADNRLTNCLRLFFQPKNGMQASQFYFFSEKQESKEPLIKVFLVSRKFYGSTIKSTVNKLIKEEAERQKTEIKSFIEKQRHNLQAKINAVSRLDEECARLIQQGEDVKREIQTFIDNFIAVIEV
ncbi:unnamed protein product [Pocillopora meandrina]|uniref:B box-type domain-containing protein n=1 Tax=Pocillopora meandrina TaxID=46732 RepID=A0AAU9X1Z9_9CNID|nr:unnamed protein product [Pocillopora meandrina]